MTEDGDPPEDDRPAEAADASGDDGPPDDPFEHLEDPAEDREGDPFEYLAGPEADEGAGATTGPRESPPADDPIGADVGDADGAEFGGVEAADSADPDAGTQPTGGEHPERGDPPADATDGAASGPGVPDEPVREVAEPRVGPEEPRQGDPFADEESVFREMDAGGRDVDRVWEDLAEAQESRSVAAAGRRTYAEVSKHSFCEACEYFSGPPEVSCSHEGTEILEFVDVETVRVADCPIVAQRRELEREG